MRFDNALINQVEVGIQLFKNIFFLVLIIFSPFCYGDEQPPHSKPLLELGLGLGGAYFPDYPGSDHNQTIYLPLPYIMYRGQSVRMDDRGGLRGRLFLATDVELDVSFSGSFPADSSENKAREGMEDLDLMVEIGPSIVWYITGLKSKSLSRWTLNLPIRQVLSLDFWRADDRGYVFNPKISFLRARLFNSSVSFFSSYQLTWATSPLMDYFYEVRPQYATAERPVFEPDAGFLGSTASLGLLFPIGRKAKKWLFLGGRYSNYDSSKNRLSPLMKKRDTFAVVVGFTYVFYESEAREKDLTNLKPLKL